MPTSTETAHPNPPHANGPGVCAELQALATRHDLPTPDGHVTWRCFGNGPALVLLHGGHGNWLHWARNIAAWARHFSVWVPDMPGYGESSTPTAPTLDGLVQGLLTSLQAVVPRSQPLAVVGFSFGGLVAAAFAAQRGNVHRLALLGPAGHGSPRRPRGELQAWRDLPAGSPAWQQAMRHNLWVQMLFEPTAIDAQAVQIHATACAATRFYSKGLSRSAQLPDWLAQVPCPLLLLFGEHDITLTPAIAQTRLSAGRAEVTTHLLPGVGHWVQYEAADAVNALVGDWLNAG